MGDPSKNISRRAQNKTEDAGTRSKTNGVEKKRQKSILKNKNQNQNLELENIHSQPLREQQAQLEQTISHEKMREEIMQSSAEKRRHADLQVIESVPPLKNEILAELLTFKKDELFDLDSLTLK